MSHRRCALALAALPLTGCFSDGGGANLTQTVTSLAPGSSTSSTDSTGSPTGTTEDPTTAPDPTSTAGPGTGSTSDPTSTTDGTTAAPVCPGEVECNPGDVMPTTSLCDPCGRVQRTCQADCTWGADECIEDLSTCAYWYFEDDEWTRVSLPQPLPEHAPAAPVVAAFELTNHNRIFALTADRFHVLQPSTEAWIASGPRTSLLPGLPGELLQAYAVADNNDTYTLYAVGDPEAWLYTLPAAGYQASLMQTSDCCNSWTDLVKPPSQAAVRDLFIDLASPYPWTTAEFYAPCIKQDINLSKYAAWVTATDVYVQDIAYCFQMVYVRSHAQFTPFAAPGAPPGALIGGTALLGERLYVFAGE